MNLDGLIAELNKQTHIPDPILKELCDAVNSGDIDDLTPSVNVKLISAVLGALAELLDGNDLSLDVRRALSKALTDAFAECEAEDEYLESVDRSMSEWA